MENQRYASPGAWRSHSLTSFQPNNYAKQLLLMSHVLKWWATRLKSKLRRDSNLGLRSLPLVSPLLWFTASVEHPLVARGTPRLKVFPRSFSLQTLKSPVPASWLKKPGVRLGLKGTLRQLENFWAWFSGSKYYSVLDKNFQGESFFGDINPFKREVSN